MREEIASLVMVGFAGTSLSPFLKRAVADTGVGGVVFLKRNVESREQLSALCTAICKYSPHKPPFLAIDQEGGMVNRVGEGLEVLPGNMALGAARSTDLSRRAGRLTALQMGALGLNLVFAPVLDVISTPENRVIGTRSFGDDSSLVAALGQSYVDGIRDGGALSTAKHFPGLGRARFDPHYEQTPIVASLDELLRDDVFPFRGSRADFVMSSHASYTCLGPESATLSEKSTRDLLRKELHYDGAVISDDLCMKAISGGMGLGEAAVEFLLAGGDMILACGGEEYLDEIIRAVEEALETDRISVEQIREKQRRLDAARRRIAGSGGGFSRNELEGLSCEIARASVTAYRIERDLLPLQVEPDERILIVETRYPRRADRPSRFVDLMRQRHGKTDAILVELVPSEEEIKRAAGLAAKAACTIMLTYNCYHYVQQLKLIDEIAQKCRKLIGIATGTPYDLVRLEAANAVLATYSYSDASMAAAIDILFGNCDAKGALPIKLSF